MLQRALALALACAALAGVPARHADASDRHSAMVLDANSGAVLHSEDADELRHPASLTKMMTLYLTFETLETGRLKMSDKITISEAAAGVAPSKLELDPGDEISVADAIKAVITKSANDIAVALAEKIGGSEANFVRLMNSRAHDIGMSKTHFENASGLPDEDQVTTARDMVTLALHLQDDYPAYYPLFATRTFTYNGSTYRNHNTMLNSFAGIDGIKTGYTRGSGFNLVTSVHRGGRHLIGAVFGGETAATRNGEMRVLLTRALTRASTIVTRKPATLLAKLKAGPKPAERPLSKRKQATAVADASIPPARALAVDKPAPFKHAVGEALPAPAKAASADTQPRPEATEAAETPLKIFKVRHVPIVPKSRTTVSPDETTDMEGLDRGPGDISDDARAATGRTDLGLFRADAGAATAGTLQRSTLADTGFSANPGAQTLVPKIEGAARRPSPLDDKIAMLGAADRVVPDVNSQAGIAPAKVAYTASTDATAQKPSPVMAQIGSKPEAASALHAAPVIRGLPPSTLAAQASALQRVADTRAPKAASGRFEVQIGAYGSVDEAQRALSSVQDRAGQLLAGIASVTHPAMKDGHQVFRARFTGFDAKRAASTCTALRRQSVDCFVMAAE